MDPVSKAQKSGGSTGKSNGLKNLRPPWEKGQSGNPAGRPKKKPLTEIYEEIFVDPKVRARIKQQIIDTMTSKGMAGVLERREAGERVEGKVAQPVDMEVKGTLTLEQVLEAKKKAGK